MANVNVHKFKKRNRENLFDKLKNWGYSFCKLKYNTERSIKINKLMNTGFLGWTQSVELKDNIKLELYLFADKLEIRVGNDVIKTIENWETDYNKTFRLITYEFDKYLYEMDELENLLPNRTDLKDIMKLLDSFYPEVKVRKINNKDNLSIFVGSGLVTYLIEKDSNESSKFKINTYFYSRMKNEYSQYFSSLPLKYRSVIKTFHNHTLSCNNLKVIKNNAKKIRTIK